jgi:hypothetical protein
LLDYYNLYFNHKNNKKEHQTAFFWVANIDFLSTDNCPHKRAVVFQTFQNTLSSFLSSPPLLAFGHSTCHRFASIILSSFFLQIWVIWPPQVDFSFLVSNIYIICQTFTLLHVRKAPEPYKQLKKQNLFIFQDPLTSQHQDLFRPCLFLEIHFLGNHFLNFPVFVCH